MHLGNGAVTPACAAIGFAAAGAGLAIGWWLARRAGRVDPLKWGAATALVFLLQTLNLPVLPQTSGHFVGGFLLAMWFGSGWGLLAMALVLGAQSLLFGDGGWLALGLNVVNMGVLPCLVVHPLWARLCGGARRGPARWAGMAGAAWASVLLASAACGLELLGRADARAQAGPLLGTLLGVHALIALIEVGVTLAAVYVASAVVRTGRARVAGWAAAGAGAVALVLGRSPWPDGLERALEVQQLGDWASRAAALAGRAQEAVAPWTGYTPGATLAACAGVAVLAGVVARALAAPRKARVLA